MFAHIDETGNTGANIFDVHQPVFMTAALITRGKFDLLYQKQVKSIANHIGNDILHAAEIGIDKTEEIAPHLLKVLKKANASFFVARVVKIDLAATKLVDTIFDSGENLAVPWHAYNFRPLRVLLVFKVARLLTEDIIKNFWSCLLEKRSDKAYEQFIQVLKDLLSRTDMLPDARSKELINEAVEWAIENPESIYLSSNARLARNGHMPNMAVFPQLLSGIEKKSVMWNRPVHEIIHDQQSQFGSTLKDWHNIISKAPPDTINWPGEEPHVFRSVFGSKFIISNARESAGIQVIDVILWLLKKVFDDNPMTPNCYKLISYIMHRSYSYEISLRGLAEYLSDFMTKLDSTPLTEGQLKRGKELLEISEKKRQERMLEYSERKLLSSSN